MFAGFRPCHTHSIHTHKRLAMPTIVEKQEVLNGRGQVIRYGSGTSAGSYFYKEKIPGERRYKTRRIPDATNIEEAVQAAVEIAFKLQRNSRLKASQTCSKAPPGTLERPSNTSLIKRSAGLPKGNASRTPSIVS